MKRRNICIVNAFQPVLGVGGIETVSYLLKEELKNNGFSVWCLYITPTAPEQATDLQLPNNDNVYCEENLRFVLDAIKKHDIDILLVNGGWVKDLLNLCIETRKQTEVKLIITSHSNPLSCIKDYDDFMERVLQNISNPISRAVKKLFLIIKKMFYTSANREKTKNLYAQYDVEHIDAFVTLNQDYTDYFKSVFPVHFRKSIYTIHNPIIIEEDTHIVEKENIVLFVGRLTAQKRLDRLLYIWKELYGRHPEWKVVVVGDGECAEEYKEIAKNLKLKNIEFVGQQPSEEYFKKSKIVCMTSSHEGLPMVLIEAQKYGCVPIAYNSFEAAKDIIQDGHNGLLIQPFKSKEYTKALDSIISDDKIREQYAKSGTQFIHKFNIKAICKKWIELFGKI